MATAVAPTPRAASSPGTSVATTPKDRILDVARSYAEQLADLAPRDMAPAHYVASLALYLEQNDKLLECNPVSIAQGLLRVARSGLELGVSCDLLPFKTTCQYNTRYNGFIELALQSGVRKVQYGLVRDDDILWDYELGTNEHLYHKPGPKKGRITHAYAYAEIKAGSFAYAVLNRDEIDDTRRRFSKSWWKESAQKGGKLIPLEDVPWYATKTAVRRLSPMLPKNARFAAALLFEDQAEEIPDADFEIQQNDSPKNETSAPADSAPVMFQEEEPETPMMTLAEAMSTVLIGQPGSWGGQAGKMLGAFSDGHLKSIRTWCASKLEERDDPDKQRMVDAATVILLERDQRESAERKRIAEGSN